MLKFSSMALICLSFFAIQVEARRDQQRGQNQASRIHQGVSSGQLTPRETKRLERGQGRIDHAEDKAMSDGSMSTKEAGKIEKMQDVQSKRIFRQKHDAQSVNNSH